MVEEQNEQRETSAPSDQLGLPVEKREKRFHLTYAGVTSTIAIIIAFLSFYVANIREIHSLQVGVVRTSDRGVTKDVDFTTDIILLNRGNRTETLLSIELSYPFADNPEGESGFIKAEKGPFVLKPGDAIPIQLTDKITKQNFENFAKWMGREGERKAELIVQVRISAVSPDGQEIRKKIQLKRIAYDEMNDIIIFPDNDSAKQLKLIELVH
jgi:hypothetical protein